MKAPLNRSLEEIKKLEKSKETTSMRKLARSRYSVRLRKLSTEEVENNRSKAYKYKI